MTPWSQAEIDVMKSAIGQQIGNNEVYTGLMVSDVPTSSPLWKSPNEPSGDGNCVTLNLQGSWLLNDLGCNNPRAYVCQISGEVHVYSTVFFSTLYGFIH